MAGALARPFSEPSLALWLILYSACLSQSSLPGPGSGSWELWNSQDLSAAHAIATGVTVPAPQRQR